MKWADFYTEFAISNKRFWWIPLWKRTLRGSPAETVAWFSISKWNKSFSKKKKKKRNAKFGAFSFRVESKKKKVVLPEDGSMDNIA